MGGEAHPKFARTLFRQSAPNRPVLQQLLSAVRRGQETILLTGAAGSGKTTIMAMLSRRVSAVMSDWIVLEHYDDAYGLQDRYVSMLRRFCRTLARLSGEEVEDAYDQHLGNQLSWLLRKVRWDKNGMA
eukprot:760818-Hanusia_phi.AAC.3